MGTRSYDGCYGAQPMRVKDLIAWLQQYAHKEALVCVRDTFRLDNLRARADNIELNTCDDYVVIEFDSQDYE